MEGWRLTMRAVCLLVVAVGLAVPGSVGQTLPAPAAPTVSNNTTTGGIDVQIAPVSGATSLVVTVSANNNVVATQGVPVVSTGGAAISFKDYIVPNVPHQVSVVAKNSSSTSAASPATSILTPPPAPTNITGLGGKLKVTVSWNAAPGATSCQLNMSNGMSFTTTATNYVVTGLQTATNYNVILASINSSGARGIFSAPVVVRTANVALQ